MHVLLPGLGGTQTFNCIIRPYFFRSKVPSPVLSNLSFNLPACMHVPLVKSSLILVCLGGMVLAKICSPCQRNISTAILVDIGWSTIYISGSTSDNLRYGKSSWYGRILKSIVLYPMFFVIILYVLWHACFPTDHTCPCRHATKKTSKRGRYSGCCTFMTNTTRIVQL